MNREKKLKADNLYITAIKNYLVEYEERWGCKFSLYDEYDKKTIYKFFLINYGLSENKTKKYLKKVLTK
jgi:hypothetical protein